MHVCPQVQCYRDMVVCFKLLPKMDVNIFFEEIYFNIFIVRLIKLTSTFIHFYQWC